jgi:hypothetical protein
MAKQRGRTDREPGAGLSDPNHLSQTPSTIESEAGQ